jgi:imidazolonepropionase-like amidohydrolase
MALLSWMIRPKAMLLSVLLSSCWGSGQTLSGIVFRHANVVDVRSGEVRHDVCVVVAQERIVSVGRDCGTAPRSARLVNARNEFLIPGLWDMHVHSNGDEQALKAMLAAGITGVRDMGGDLQKLSRARRAISAGEWQGPTLMFAGPMLEGPPGRQDTDTWIVRTPAEAQQAVSELAGAKVDFIKVHDHLSREVYFAIAAAAKAHALPFAGHVTEVVSPVEASNAGQASVEHFEFLPKECVPQLGTNRLSLDCESSAASSLSQLARNGTFLDPTLQSFRYFAPERWEQIRKGFRGVAGEIRRAHVAILAGTDWSGYLRSKGASAGWCLHDELGILVEEGFTPLEALQAATLNPAIFFGFQRTAGTIEPGKNADLVLLASNPLADIRNTRKVAGVVVRGRFVLSR